MTLNENGVYTKPHFFNDETQKTLYINFERGISSFNQTESGVHQKQKKHSKSAHTFAMNLKTKYHAKNYFITSSYNI